MARPVVLAFLAAGLIVGAAAERRPYRSLLAQVAARAPVAKLLARAGAASSEASGVISAPVPEARRELRETCDKPFQIVDAGERCTAASESQQLRMCKMPLRCISGRCKRVKEGDFCVGDAMCDGASSNLEMLCIDSKCKHLVEAGDSCGAGVECFSGTCSKEGKCSGMPQGRECTFTSTGKDTVFQNPCAEGLHCSLHGSKADGRQLATCELPAIIGEDCLTYSMPVNPNREPEAPDWFMTAYISAVYAACKPGHVCEVRGNLNSSALVFGGTCRLLLHTPAGAKCHSDMVCEPPYSCISGVCAASPAECGDATMVLDTDEEEARSAGMLHGCASNERCDCPEGVGECVAIHDECANEEQRLVRCMATHGCPWVDAGASQCAEQRCLDEDVAFECCKYRAPQFEKNIDWEAMQHLYDVDVHEKCSHIVSGSIFGLPHRGERVVLELNGRNDQIVEHDGAFAFSQKLNHLDPFNVSISNQAWFGECSVTNGVGVAKDDVHDVIVYCNGARSGGQSESSSAGAVFAGLFVPCVLLSACFAAAALAIGRRNGGGAREGFNILVQGARDLPRTLPSVQVPSFSGGGGGYAPDHYFAGSGNEYAAGNHITDAIPEAMIVDAATGQPVVRASVVQ